MRYKEALMIYKLSWSLFSSRLLTAHWFYAKFPDFYADIFPTLFLFFLLFLSPPSHTPY